jgi:hypothetical protein
MPRPSHPTWLDHSNVHYLIITDLPPFSCNIPISQLISRSFISFNKLIHQAPSHEHVRGVNV